MGKPGPSGSSPAEYIGREKRTQGTETSKYLKEKKSKEILSVAASERGRAWRDLWLIEVEESGKADRRG